MMQNQLPMMESFLDRLSDFGQDKTHSLERLRLLKQLSSYLGSSASLKLRMTQQSREFLLQEDPEFLNSLETGNGETQGLQQNSEEQGMILE